MTPNSQEIALPFAESGSRDLGELARAEIPHLEAAFSPHLATPTKFSLSLPYSSLEGPGFERLCFHLLLAFGKRPRFFGVRGQAQYGIDLIVSDGEQCDVYQCKNVAGYNDANLQTDLEKFEREWLNKRPGLPRPEKFVLCVPEPLTGRDE